MTKKGAQPKNKNAEKWNEAKAIELGEKLITWMHQNDQNLFLEEFTMKHGYYRSVIEYLCKKYKSFAEYVEKAKQIQEIKLCKLGLSRKSHPAITIFLLKNNHGYSDQKKMDLTTDGESIKKQIYRLGDGTEIVF